MTFIIEQYNYAENVLGLMIMNICTHKVHVDMNKFQNMNTYYESTTLQISLEQFAMTRYLGDYTQLAKVT